MFLVVVDTYSKWLEVFNVPSANSIQTIEKFRVAFCTHGLPETLVSDNCSAFTSEEFTEFLKRNNVAHILSAPYHPSSNGPAERTVQTFKSFMEKQEGVKVSIDSLICRFLFSYRNTPHSRTGISPSEMLMKRRPRTHLSCLKPDLQSKARKSVKDPEEIGKIREFQVGDAVIARNYRGGDKWVKGVVSERMGPVSYKVRIEGGVIRRHIDQLVRNALPKVSENLDKSLLTEQEERLVNGTGNDREMGPLLPASRQLPSVSEETAPVPSEVVPDTPIASPDSTNSDVPLDVVPRRSTRDRQPPPYLKEYTS